MKSPRFLVALILAGALLLGAGSPATAAAPTPPVMKKLAKKLQCKWPEETSLAGGGKNSGISCTVNNSHGRQEVYLLRYRNMARALDHWRDWLKPWSETDPPRCIVKKGKLLIIPMAGGSGVDDNAYSEKWCQYIVSRVGGRIVYNYPI